MQTRARTPNTHIPAPAFFHGWVVVGGVFLVLFAGFGAAYSFGAFFRALRDEFGATRAGVSLVFAITGFLYFALGAVSGRLADRVGPRRIVAAGAVLIGLGLVLAAFTRALWQVYATYSLGVGIGVGLAYVPAVGAVQRWFVRRRGFATGIAVAGIGLGNLVMPPLAAWLVRLGGWRIAYVVIGLGALALALVGAWLIERGPEERGLAPDGDPPGAAGAGRALAGLTPGEALRAPAYWLLYASGIATSLGIFIPFVHIPPYAEDHGIGNVAAAVIVGAIGAGSAGGRLFLGGLADRIGRRQALFGSFILMAAMLLWWLAATEVWSLLIFAVLFGVGYGGFVALIPALASDYFGVRHVGSIIGLLYTSAAIGTLVGPTLAGIAFDLRDSYTLPIVLSAAANLVAAGCMVALGSASRAGVGGRV